MTFSPSRVNTAAMPSAGGRLRGRQHVVERFARHELRHGAADERHAGAVVAKPLVVGNLQEHRARDAHAAIILSTSQPWQPSPTARLGCPPRPGRERMQRTDARELRPDARTSTTTSSVAKPPPTTDAVGPNSAAVDAALERAELVREADEHVVDRRDAAAQVIGRDRLLERQADDDADVVEDAGEEQADQRQRERCATGRSRSSRGRIRRRRSSSTRPGCAHGLQARRDQRHASARRRRARARSQPRPAGPDLQDVLREDRQQRHRAAEQHGEQIERDRRRGTADWRART